MAKTALELLSKFVEYGEYDENQKSFNLLSSNYYFNRAVKAIKSIMPYDPTGTIAVLYARHSLESLFSDISIKAIEFLSDPHAFDEDFEIWNLFHSRDVDDMAQALLERIDSIIQQVVPAKMLGKRDANVEMKALMDSIGAIVDELDKCNVDLFLRGGSIGSITKVNTQILVYERLADCLLDLERADDGIYLCYINNYGTADGYFGYYIKGNGTLISVNERVNEAFPGQHQNSRNNRWEEQKKYGIFPYQIFQFDDYDYLGYAKNHTIDKGQLAFFGIGPEAYMPIVLAMVLLSTKYASTDVQTMPMKFVDSLLPQNRQLESPDIRALVIPADSAIAKVAEEYTLEHLTSDSVLSGELGKRYAYGSPASKGKHHSERGAFLTEENIFVQLYGSGFQLDTSKLLVSSPHLRLTDGETKDGEETGSGKLTNNEFVGTRDRLDMIAYMQARQQLADYIRDQMYAEYKAFGGVEAIYEWYNFMLQRHKQHILSLCIQAIDGEKIGIRKVKVQENCRGDIEHTTRTPFNMQQRTSQRYEPYVYCSVSATKVSIACVLEPRKWEELKVLFPGEEIPKILVGWNEDAYRGCGNPLLDATDPVSWIGTPFELEEGQYNSGGRYKNEYPAPTTVTFRFGVGFSKRGLAKLRKELAANG